MDRRTCAFTAVGSWWKRERGKSGSRDGRETRYEGAGALVPSNNRRLPGCKRAKHDHLLERRARLLRYDSSLSAGSHVSLQHTV